MSVPASPPPISRQEALERAERALRMLVEEAPAWTASTARPLHGQACRVADLAQALLAAVSAPLLGEQED